MRIVHFADCHLGFRRFEIGVQGTRYSSNAGLEIGKNQREADIEVAFRAVVEETIAIKPDLIIIGGDFFDHFKPRNGTIVFAMEQLRRLVGIGAPIVLACGNHDLPKTRDTAPIFGLLRQLGIFVAEWEPETFTFPDRNLSVLAVPDAPGMTRPALIPNPAFKYNVLVLHGEVHGVPRVHGDRFGIEIPTEELNAPAWNYIGLGHWHVHQQIAPNVFYAGSIEYTSSNVWGELEDEKRFGLDGKVFVEHNLETGEHTLHPLPHRDHLDLKLSAHGLSAEELSVAMREVLDDAHPDATVTRFVVTDCPREVSAKVDHKMLREFKSRALNLNVEYRKPGIVVTPGRITTARRRIVLEDFFEDHVRARAARGEFPADVSLDDCVALGRKYLAQADAIVRGGDSQELEAKLEASVEAVA